jgi:hypothetical protein
LSSTILQLAPLAERTENENRNDRSAAGRDHRTNEEAETKRGRAFARALHIDEAISNQAAREAYAAMRAPREGSADSGREFASVS